MQTTDLEDALSRPTPATVEALAALQGDLVVLGAGGKMGPSLARMARRGLDEAGSNASVFAVARFSKAGLRDSLAAVSVRTVQCDMLDRDAVARLPDAAAVLFMAGTKFGTTGDASTTWAQNAWMPGLVAERYAGVPTVVFSSGNIYPFVDIDSGGATEDTPPAPVGEYAWSVLARERIFEHFAARAGTPLTIYRLNYAAELRYGVPVDIARKVFQGQPIDLATGHFNVIWQGDANATALACVGLAARPTRVLNVTGADTVSVRELALQFGAMFGKEPIFTGDEQPTALLSDASRCIELFGPPTVSMEQLTHWIADRVRDAGETLDAPTHYDVRDGAF